MGEARSDAASLRRAVRTKGAAGQARRSAPRRGDITSSKTNSQEKSGKRQASDDSTKSEKNQKNISSFYFKGLPVF